MHLHFCLKILLPLSGLQCKQDALKCQPIRGLCHGRRTQGTNTLALKSDLLPQNRPPLPLQNHCCLISAYQARGNARTMVAVSGTEGKCQGDAQPEPSCAGAGGVLREEPKPHPPPALPPHAVGLNPPWLAPSSYQYLAVGAELADTGPGRSLGDSSPQMSGRDPGCLSSAAIHISTNLRNS